MAYLSAMLNDTDTRGVPTNILTLELERSIAIETFDIVLELDDTYPEREFTWVFGADSTETMADWQTGQASDCPIGSITDGELNHGS